MRSDFDERLARLAEDARCFDLSTREGRKVSHASLRDFFVDLQTSLKLKLSFEIGANEARFSRQLRAALPEAQIIAFEANPYTFEKMTGHFDFRRMRIEYLHLAITRRREPATFNIQRRRYDQELDPTLGDNSLMPRLRKGLEIETVTVPGISLCDFANERGLTEPFSAWIDVEGATQLVLEGMAPTLERALSLQIEVEEAAAWAGQWLAPEVFAFLEPFGFVPVARDFEYPSQFNIVLLKRELLGVPDVAACLQRRQVSLDAMLTPP